MQVVHQRKFSILRLGSSFAMILGLPVAAQAGYTYTNVASIVAASIGSTPSQSRAYAINTAGTLVGTYQSGGTDFFFTLAPGASTITPFATVSGRRLDYFTTLPMAGHQINDAGNYLADNAVASDTTGKGGYYSPTTGTYTSFPNATTYEVPNTQVATGFQPYAINATNSAVGVQFFEVFDPSDPTGDPSPNNHGVVYNSVTRQTIDIGGAVPNSGGDATNGASTLKGISNTNVVVGSSTSGSGRGASTVAIVGTPSGASSYTVTDLSSVISAGVKAGFSYGGTSEATNISANGVYIVGTYDAAPDDGSSDVIRGFRINTLTNTAVDLGDLGGTSTFFDLVDPTAVDDAGNVVGTAIAGGGASHGFLYSGGTIADINSLVAVPNTTFTEVSNINDAGQLVGYANATGPGGSQFSAFLLTPSLTSIPEPTAVSIAAFVGVGCLTRRRRNAVR